MTTILGIRATQGKSGVILASDLQRTRTDLNEGGEVIHKVLTKADAQKIYIDDAQNLAICMTGTFDQRYIDFLNGIRSGKIDVEKAIRDKFFRELHDLTESRWGFKYPTNDLNCLVMATRFGGEPRLYDCYPLGLVTETNFTTAGAGSEYASRECEQKRADIPRYISLSEASQLAIKGLESATRDIYTGGLDIVVVTGDKITPMGHIVQRELANAKFRYKNKIKKSLE